MARVEWVKLRLNNWALWKVREQSGGLGWASQSAFCNEPKGGYRESIVPVDDVDAELTNQAVESLKVPHAHLYTTLQCIYPHGIGIQATARQLFKVESTVKAYLDQADHYLAQWFRDRTERQHTAARST